MGKYIFISITIISLFLNACSYPDDSAKKEKQKKDSVIASKYAKGIEYYNMNDYSMAKYYFDDVPDSNKYYAKSQEYLNIINDTIEVYKQNTLLLIKQIDIYLKDKIIFDDLLYDSLISKGILDEDWIKEKYEEDYNDYRYDYDGRDY